MSKIRESILQGIHSGAIKPRSRGHYLVLHTLLWIACISALIFGTLSVALLFFELNSPEYVFMQWMEENDLLWLRVLPLFWSFCAVIALVLWYLLFSKTERGYRVSTFLILVLLCWGSLAGGFSLYYSGIIHLGDKQIRKLEPRYDHFRNRFQLTLPGPEQGELFLRVQSHNGSLWKGKSLNGDTWQVLLQCSSTECEAHVSEIKFGGPPILFFWKITGENTFTAFDLRLPPRTPRERREFRQEFMRRTLSGEVRAQQKR